jgi:hypothetical protein
LARPGTFHEPGVAPFHPKIRLTGGAGLDDCRLDYCDDDADCDRHPEASRYPRTRRSRTERIMTNGGDGSGSPNTHDVAIVGAGVVGCTVAWALTKAGRRVLLIDRADPATAGASFGNVGHIATEQLQPLPSPQLLLSFWRELVAFGGVLDIPLRRVAVMAPWMVRFALAAFHQRSHTRHLAPLVRSAADALHSQLCEVGGATFCGGTATMHSG